MQRTLNQGRTTIRKERACIFQKTDTSLRICILLLYMQSMQSFGSDCAFEKMCCGRNEEMSEEMESTNVVNTHTLSTIVMHNKSYKDARVLLLFRKISKIYKTYTVAQAIHQRWKSYVARVKRGASHLWICCVSILRAVNF